MQVTPSTFQVNEGESLTTSLIGFTPGSTVYFKVGGRGISKKDFAAGGVKGTVQVDANGVASIAHTIRADKVTEGDESFSIQVFSDKKMRNLVGSSDAVGIGDTSVKARKGVKTPNSQDIIKNLYWESPDGTVRVNSDNVIDDYDNWPQINGDFPFEAPKSRGTILSEFEFNDRFYVDTRIDNQVDEITGQRRAEISRFVAEGTFRYADGKLVSGTVNRVVKSTYLSDEGGRLSLYGDIEEYSGGVSTSIFAPLRLSRQSFLFNGTETAEFSFSPSEGYSFGAEKDRQAIEGFANGRFFQEGWWNNPFTPNLI